MNTYRERINNGLIALKSSHVGGIIYVGMHDRHLDSLFDPTDYPLVFAYSHGTSQRITRCATSLFYFLFSG